MKSVERVILPLVEITLFGQPASLVAHVKNLSNVEAMKKKLEPCIRFV